jgi:hypothetical protein
MAPLCTCNSPLNVIFLHLNFSFRASSSYVNIHPPAGRFQVDVGPILFPDFASTEELIVDRIHLAYLLFNQPDEVEFAIREATVVADGQSAQTLHYSKVVKIAATSELFSLSN